MSIHELKKDNSIIDEMYNIDNFIEKIKNNDRIYLKNLKINNFEKYETLRNRLYVLFTSGLLEKLGLKRYEKDKLFYIYKYELNKFSIIISSSTVLLIKENKIYEISNLSITDNLIGLNNLKNYSNIDEINQLSTVLITTYDFRRNFNKYIEWRNRTVR